MGLQLIPGLLAEQKIEYDDAQHKLMVNLHLVPLSATQYTLVVALLRQRLRYQEDTTGRMPLLLTIRQLQQLAQLSDPALVKQHLRRASSRLVNHGWLIVCLHGFGYAIFKPEEVLWLSGPSAPFARGPEANVSTNARQGETK